VLGDFFNFFGLVLVDCHLAISRALLMPIMSEPIRKSICFCLCCVCRSKQTCQVSRVLQKKREVSNSFSVCTNIIASVGFKLWMDVETDDVLSPDRQFLGGICCCVGEKRTSLLLCAVLCCQRVVSK